MDKQPLVGILMGSDSDWPIMRAAAVALKNLDIPYEAKVLSAHRTPEGASRALSARRGGGDSEIADAMRPREKITSIPLLD